MRTKAYLTLAALALSLAASGGALAGNGNGKANGRGHLRHYVFVGQLASSPNDGDVRITVVGGNHAALRAMLGQSVDQIFSYGENSEFLQWANGVPTVVGPGDLASGTYVRVNVRASRGASLSDIEHVAAGIVGDHGTQLYKPSQPLYLFRGTLASTGDSSVTLDVRGGNARAMRLLIGQSTHQTFATGDETIFLLWQGKVPSVIDLSQLKTGDRVVVRVRAPRGSGLSQVESTAAKHVGDREPANG